MLGSIAVNQVAVEHLFVHSAVKGNDIACAEMPVQRCTCAYMLIAFAFSRTTVFGVWVIEWISRNDLEKHWWNLSRRLNVYGAQPISHMCTAGMSAHGRCGLRSLCPLKPNSIF